MSDPTLSPETERQLAIDLFNRVWTLINKPDRTPADSDTMLHAAHASRYHWGEIGQPENLARGEWQISRVYTVLKRPEPAHYHAQRCLDLCLQNSIGDWDLAYAYEALARAAMVAQAPSEMHHYLELARQAGANITEQDDKELLDADLATIHSKPLVSSRWTPTL